MLRCRAGGGSILCRIVPSGACDVEPDVRAHDRAAVGDRRVRDGELQRRTCTSPWPTARLTLSPIDHGRLVPSAIPQPPGECLRLALERTGRGVALGLELVASAAPRRRRAACPPPRRRGRSRSAGRSRTARAHCCSAPPFGCGTGLGVHQRAEVVEEHVVGDPDRVDEVEHAVGGAAGVVQALRRRSRTGPVSS